jgi:hypothetical protein
MMPPLSLPLSLPLPPRGEDDECDEANASTSEREMRGRMLLPRKRHALE